MADAPIVHIGENSPEQIAFKLMQQIAVAEKKNLWAVGPASDRGEQADRKWILETYRECIKAVRGEQSAAPGNFGRPL
jgi:hypothetical protein